MAEPYPDNVVMAFVEYLRRFNRYTEPAGERIDGLWIPDTLETRKCCKEVKMPTMMLAHCRSLEHICALYGADVALVRKIVKIYKGHMDAPASNQPSRYYKAVQLPLPGVE